MPTTLRLREGFLNCWLLPPPEASCTKSMDNHRTCCFKSKYEIFLTALLGAVIRIFRSLVIWGNGSRRLQSDQEIPQQIPSRFANMRIHYLSAAGWYSSKPTHVHVCAGTTAGGCSKSWHYAMLDWIRPVNHYRSIMMVYGCVTNRLEKLD